MARDSTRDIRLDEIQEDASEEIMDYSNIPMDIGNSGSMEDTPVHVEEPVNEPVLDAPLDVQEDNVIEISDDSQEQNVVQEVTPRPIPRRSNRVRHEPDRYLGIHEIETEEPESYAEMVERPDSQEWLEAMKSEMQSMKDN